MDDRHLIEEITAREVLFDGHVVHLEKWRVRLPGGGEATREAVLHAGGVAVVACDKDGRIALVRQHRVVVGEVLSELPAGKLDKPGENRLEAAKRELKEETGLTAKTWTHLADVVTSPGFSSEKLSLYLATDLSEGAMALDQDETLDASRVPAQSLYEQVYAGQIADLKTACALLMAKPILEQLNLI